MEDQHQQQRARFVSRSPTMSVASPSSGRGGTTGGRSQWHGMDLHTTAPSSNRRAMYTSPVPIQNTAATIAHATAPATAISGDNARQRAEAAALSARNQMLHRRLSERKRFDSADYAMKMVRHAMQSDHPTGDPSAASMASPSPTGSFGEGMAPSALQSPRLSPSHGRMMFAHALTGDRSGESDNYEMKDASDNQELTSPTPARGYGALQAATSTKSANAALSARNIMIQRKLQEKRHFDSADYQLARLGVATDVVMDQVGKPALDRSDLLHLDPEASSPVRSPSASAARSNQMSPSVRASSGGATAFGASKYGGLGTRAAAAKSQHDLRRNALMRQQETFIAAHTAEASAPAGAASASSGNQKFGKLIAANILFRKNLKDRQRFDSADYEMEAAARQAEQSGETDAIHASGNSATSPAAASNQDDEPSSPVLKPQAKHMKLSDNSAAVGGWAKGTTTITTSTPQPVAAGRGGWAAHPAVAAARQMQTTAREDGARLAARSVVLSRTLSEGKKLFDSGEYFLTKEKEARAASNRRQV
jgi:hypothetical protein